MKPSSKNEVMNGIVNAYIAQKALDKANNTHYADTWKILNGADDEIDASLTFDLSEGEWDSVKTYLKENKISFALCLVSYKDGHSQNSFVWYDDQHIYAVEMNEIGSVTFHVIDNANKETIKPTDETSSSILKMLLALENGGANGGGGSGDSANWLNYHVEFKAGGPISIKPSIEDNGLFLGSFGTDSYSGIYTIYSSIGSDKEKITNPRSFYNKNAVNGALFGYKKFAVDTKDNNKIIEINGYQKVSSDYPNVYFKYNSRYNYPYFGISNIDNLENGDYTLNYVYALGVGDSDYDRLEITSDKNVGKIHMIIEDNTIAPSSTQYKHQMRAAEGETGILFTYLEGVPETFFLISMQLVKGWQE